MASAPRSKSIPLATVAESLDRAIARLDQLRAADLAEVALVQAVKRESFERERARLAAKLGADHPRVAALDQRAAVEDAFVAELAVEQSRAGVTSPVVDDKSWAFHGHVLDEDRRPVRGATVALYAGERWVEPLGHAATDESGYFRLQPRGALDAQHPPLSLRVRAGKVTIHEEPEPVTVMRGSVEYREISVRLDHEVVVPPPRDEPSREPPVPPAPIPVPRPRPTAARASKRKK